MATITAIEISDKAINTAYANIIKHQVSNQISIIESDWYSSLTKKQKYDYIVSNPPYICRLDINQMSKETVDFEPDIALYADNNGMSSYQAIIENSHRFLKHDGKIILEIGWLQKNIVSMLLKQHRFKNILVKQDLSALDRVIIAH